MVRLSEKSRLMVELICTAQQMTVLIGTVWLVGWKSWSGWWFVLALLLMESCVPSRVISGLEKA